MDTVSDSDPCRDTEDSESPYSDPCEDPDDLENTFKFTPALYRQRYEKVIELLLDPKWKDQLNSLVDFGCAELKLFTLLKYSTDLKQISLVDVDEGLLEDRLMLVNPLAAEYLRRRKHPLKVNVFVGSVTDPDSRLLGHEVVTAVELIEHLYPDEVEAFSFNIFHFIAPKMVIITTPNSDFNVVFSNDTKRFRHFDHKFEWSREQFEGWARNVTDRFTDYTVSFFGIGKGPPGSENLGECSQMALFLRKDLLDSSYIINKTVCLCDSSSGSNKLKTCRSCFSNSSYGICTYQNLSQQKCSSTSDNTDQSQDFYFKCLTEVCFPYDDDNRTDEEKVMDEIRYRINNLMNYQEPVEIDETFQYQIPIKLLLRPNENLVSLEELEIMLRESAFVLRDCIDRQTESAETCVIIPDPERDSDDSSSIDSTTNNDYEQYHLNEVPLNWNDEEWDKNCELNNCS